MLGVTAGLDDLPPEPARLDGLLHLLSGLGRRRLGRDRIQNDEDIERLSHPLRVRPPAATLNGRNAGRSSSQGSRLTCRDRALQPRGDALVAVCKSVPGS